jgi:hypothetical protein
MKSIRQAGGRGAAGRLHSIKAASTTAVVLGMPSLASLGMSGTPPVVMLCYNLWACVSEGLHFADYAHVCTAPEVCICGKQGTYAACMATGCTFFLCSDGHH